MKFCRNLFVFRGTKFSEMSSTNDLKRVLILITNYSISCYHSVLRRICTEGEGGGKELSTRKAVGWLAWLHRPIGLIKRTAENHGQGHVRTNRPARMVLFLSHKR